MKNRHLITLSLGGVIGTGLFFNTGYMISTTGAPSTPLAYLIGALVVWLVMQSLGELGQWRWDRVLRRPLSVCSTGFLMCMSGYGVHFSMSLFLH